MEALLALAGFSIVSAVTPGPNNVLLWASGAAFGLRASARHIVGSAVGIGGMALVLSGGIGAVLVLVPELNLVLKLAASAYLLVLAWQVAGVHALRPGVLGHPLGIRQAAAFQAVNPKAWVFALGAVTTFRPPDLDGMAGSLAVVTVMACVILPAAALWAVAGEAMGHLLSEGRRGRIASGLMGLVVAVTVISVWV